MIVATYRSKPDLIRCIQIGTAAGRPACWGAAIVLTIGNYYGQTQTHVITHDAKTHLGIDGGPRRSVCFSARLHAARNVEH